MKLEDVSAGYERLWATMELKDSMKRECEWAAAKVLSGRSNYELVEKKSGVPWFVVGLIHVMEAGGDFSKHLHNGDPLLAKTVNEPKGRPKVWDSPWDWTTSALDALQYDKLDQVKIWTLPQIAYCFEKFNGWGYQKYHKEVANPYLWSGCAAYAKGKYVEDGKWDGECVSEQVGAMVVLRRLCEMVPEIGLQPPPKLMLGLVSAPATTTPESFPKARPKWWDGLGQSRTIWGGLSALFSVLLLVLDWLGQAAEFIARTGLDVLAKMTQYEPLMKFSPSSKWIGGAIGVLAALTAIYAKLSDAKAGVKK